MHKAVTLPFQRLLEFHIRVKCPLDMELKKKIPGRNGPFALTLAGREPAQPATMSPSQLPGGLGGWTRGHVEMETMDRPKKKKISTLISFMVKWLG